MKQNFIKLFKTAIISLILLLFINVESKGQSPVIDFSYSPDTITQGDIVTFTNLSTNVNDSIIFIWEFPHCIYISHFNNSISCYDTTYNVNQTVNYQIKYNIDYTITLQAINKYNNKIVGTKSTVLKDEPGDEADCPTEICTFLCNGDFETLDSPLSPPTGRGQMGSYTMGWFNDNYPKSTPDLFDRASNANSGVSIPNNFAGYQETHHPNVEHGYAGLLNFLPDSCGNPTNYREYVKQVLRRPMNIGQDYVVGMYYSLSPNSRFTNDNLGICLTLGTPVQDYSNEGIYCNGHLMDTYGINKFTNNGLLHQILQPQVKLSNSIPDKGTWHKLTGIVHATQAYDVLTIGGFKSNDSTVNYSFNDGSSMIVDAGGQPVTTCYIYIDSVFVYPLLKNKSHRDTICLASNITLTSSVMPPSTTYYTWSANIHGTGLDSITIKPKNDTVVVCTAMDSYGCTMVDTFYIKIQYPLINITAENTCFGQPTNFSAHYQTCPDSIYAYSWDFGDGSPVSTLSNPSHTYASPGNYRACLTYTIYGGFMRSTCDSVQISNPPSLQVAGPNNDCDPIATYTIMDPYPRGTYSYLSNGEFITIVSNTFQYNTNLGNLVVSYTNQEGCTVYDTIHIFACCTADSHVLWANDTINSDSTITRNHIINGTVVINSNVTFKHGSVRMGPEARFVVKAGKSLIFYGATVKAGCNYMWDGIYAETPTSLIKIDSSSIVQDAINGIVSSNGGQIFLRNSSFRYNYYNVVIRNYITIYNHPAYISGCRFIGADALPYPPMNPLATFIGIVIDSVGNENTGGSTNYYATIGDTIAGTTGGSIITNSKCNYFRKTGVGIFVKNSNAKIYNCYFSRENNTYGTGSAVYIQGKTLSGQQVNNVKHIVNIGGSNPKRIVVDSSYVGVYSDKNIDLKIIKNKFYNNLFGVVFAENNYNNGASTYNSVQINYNTFLTCNYSVYSASNNRCVTDVKYNRINDSTTSVGWYSYGILMNGSQQNSERAYIWNNNITSKGTGISALAFDSTISINYNFIKIPAYSSTTFGIQVQNCYPAIINNNVVTTPDSLYSYGISVEQSNSATVKCDSVRGLNFGIRFAGANLPGNFSTVKGNSFNKCTNGLVKTNAGIIGNQISSTNCSDNKWYNYPAGYSHTYCYNSFGEIIYSRNITSGIYNPAINGFSVGFQPFSKLPGISTLYVCGALPQGMMSSIQTNSTNDAVNLYESIANENNNYSLGNISAEYLAKQSLYKLMLNEPALFTSNVNMQQFKADNDNLSMGQITRAEFLLSNNDIVNAAILNNSAQPSNQIEEKLKMMIAYKIQLLKTDSLSANQLDDIRELAKQCPFELGTSVYFARAVISKYDLNIRYNNPCEYIGIIKNKMFEPSTPEGENTEVRPSDIRVMPNPANDKLCVELNLETSGNICIFELYDLTGKKIISMILPHDNLNNINLNEMTEGAYIYKIIVNGSIAKTDKLIIIK